MTFQWTLDESKYLSLKEVKKLRRKTEKAKAIALEKNKRTPVMDWMVVELGLFAGLRVEEMSNLKCGDLLIQDVQSSLIVRKGKGGRKRIIRICSELKENLNEFLNWKQSIGENIADESPLFVSSKTETHMTTRALQKSFKRSAKRAGLKSHYSIHCLRHTFGSHLYKASKYNLRLVQEQLGHSRIETTKVYASVMDPDVERAVERLYQEY
jgi:site-specific recombinase XerD